MRYYVQMLRERLRIWCDFERRVGGLGTPTDFVILTSLSAPSGICFALNHSASFFIYEKDES